MSSYQWVCSCPYVTSLSSVICAMGPGAVLIRGIVGCEGDGPVKLPVHGHPRATDTMHPASSSGLKNSSLILALWLVQAK